jgi:hypothetical protein
VILLWLKRLILVAVILLAVIRTVVTLVCEGRRVVSKRSSLRYLPHPSNQLREGARIRTL